MTPYPISALRKKTDCRLYYEMMTTDSATVAELEAELKNIRAAFEEYIASSRELEDGLDRELADMRTYDQ